jgi:hypothetical protein
MDGLPIAVLVAAPIIAIFVIFFLLPWMRREQEKRDAERSGKKRSGRD